MAGMADPGFPQFSAWRLGLALMRRDARAGELRLLILALVVAVASITSVGFLSSRVSQALVRDSAQMLGADLVLQADAPIPTDFSVQARRLGLNLSAVEQFPSMASSASRAQLVSLKAVEPGYPLRGVLRVAGQPYGPDAATRDVPAPGTVWVDAQLPALLGIKMGDSIALGDAHLRVAKVLSYEPDRGMQFIDLAPRVLMNLSDLPATDLVVTGSRVDYFLLAAGPPDAVAGYRAWLESRLGRGQKLASLGSGRPEVRRTLDRAQRFLALVALLAVMIAAVAVALAAGRFMQRHRDGIAVMRCLGAQQAQVTRLLRVEFGAVGLFSCAAGCALGYGVHQVLVWLLSGLINTHLPAPSFLPALQGMLTGMLLLLGFAMPSLSRLRRVPPARVLRRDLDAAPLRDLAGYALGALGMALMIWWFAGDARLAVIVAGGFLGAFLAFALAAWLCVLALGRLRNVLQGAPALRFALAGVVRRRLATITQVCALAVGLMALLLLTLTRTDLIAGWQRSLPLEAPNRFLINVQDDQRDAVSRQLADAGLVQAKLLPMVRGRLIAVNGKPVGPDDYDDPRAKRLVDREFNLSYDASLPKGNRIAQGRWLRPHGQGEVSLETGLAQRLRLHLGDRLVFEVGGQDVDARVTSLRTVDWDSMRVNFFAILSPATLSGLPRSWITSFYLPPGRGAVLRVLVARFPNLTVFDVAAILQQLQVVLAEVSRAVQLLFAFTLLAGMLVLAAALASTRDERVREAAVLRALGATRVQLARTQRIELLAVGALAGLLAAFGAVALAWLLAEQVFRFTMAPSLWPWLAGPAAGMLVAWTGGALALRGVLRAPPLVSLRET
ncbi:ABC transporter permease [Bordetella sp. FB-8]|uniref:ABC transporter permease n=1 Tax=Bordetella sp. FB-8 TaxID=1159870 RepID=UPI00036ADE2F|nr:FtsX-like permease family protein [Bordetella sp. FB-8]